LKGGEVQFESLRTSVFTKIRGPALGPPIKARASGAHGCVTGDMHTGTIQHGKPHELLMVRVMGEQ